MAILINQQLKETKMTIEKGSVSSKEYTVQSEETAVKVGSGGLSVLATPVLACWVEEVAYTMLQKTLPEGQSSVGIKLDLDHISATPVGLQVTVETKVKEIDRKKVVFEFTAHDSKCKIAHGIHERMVIDIEKFLSKVNDKSK